MAYQYGTNHDDTSNTHALWCDHGILISNSHLNINETGELTCPSTFVICELFIPNQSKLCDVDMWDQVFYQQAAQLDLIRLLISICILFKGKYLPDFPLYVLCLWSIKTWVLKWLKQYLQLVICCLQIDFGTIMNLKRAKNVINKAY